MIVRILKKFSIILTNRQKVRILELILLMIIGGLMEMMSVSLILPFTEAVMDPEKTMQKSYVVWFCKIMNLDDAKSFLWVIAIIMAVLYLVKNVFLLFQLGVQTRFVYNNMFFTQRKLLNKFLSRPYEYYLSINSGEVLRIIGNDTTQVFDLLTTLLQLLSEFVVSLVLIITIFAIAPQVTIGMVILLLVLVLVVTRVIRPILQKAGVENQNAYAGMNQWLLQAMQGIKEVKIMRKENFFNQQFCETGQIYIRAIRQYNTLRLVPRYMIEAISMSSFFVVVSVMIYINTDLKLLVPMISSIAIAAIRLLPAANRISAGLAAMSYSEPMLDKMIENLDEVSKFNLEEEIVENKGVINGFIKDICLNDVTYKYPEGEKEIIRNASIIIKKGESIGIVGASGEGKTTIMDLILGLLRPLSGSVQIDGINIALDMNGWLSEVGYIPQNIFMLDGNIKENVAFGETGDSIDDAKVWKALKDAALDDYVRSLPEKLLTEIGERGIRLSGGQKQRIGIARALYNNPSVLFFDEATSALDTDTETAVMESINHLHGEKTLIIIAHRLTTIENCDHVFRVDNGVIKKEK